MEEPLRFDIWCECDRVNREAVADFLRRLRPEPPVAEPTASLSRRRMVLKFLRRRWREVEALRAAPSPWLLRVTVYQESYGPERAELLEHSEAHDLHYAGVIGCRVCTGFFQA